MTADRSGRFFAVVNKANNLRRVFFDHQLQLQHMRSSTVLTLYRHWIANSSIFRGASRKASRQRRALLCRGSRSSTNDIRLQSVCGSYFGQRHIETLYNLNSTCRILYSMHLYYQILAHSSSEKMLNVQSLRCSQKPKNIIAMGTTCLSEKNRYITCYAQGA